MANEYPHRHLHAHVHGGRIGVLVEIGCESDVLARSDEFKALIRDIALQIIATAPTDTDGLLRQPFVKDESITVSDLVRQAAGLFGERIGITRFVRWSTEDASRPEAGPSPRTPAVILPFRRME